MVNQSKINDSRFWEIWEASGAVSKMDTPMSKGPTRVLLEEAISMIPVKEKLRDLEKYMPKSDDTIHDFGRYLADRLNDRLVPEGFNLGAELALYDLQTGIDGFTGQPIR